jgi:hypothetical protein
MFGGRVAEAVRPGIIALKRNCAGRDRKRMRDSRRHAGETYGPAGRHEEALVAINRRRRLRRTARHVVRHLVHRGRCRHVGRCHLRWRHFRRRHLVRHRRHRSLRGRRRHDRPGNRSQCKARDHQDREQPAYGKVAFHRFRFSRICGSEKFTLQEFSLPGIDRYQTSDVQINLLSFHTDRACCSPPVLPTGNPARASPP